jgi:hypothetical protein
VLTDCYSKSGLVQFRTEDLGPQHRLVQVELAVQLLDDLRRGLEVDDRVDALGLLADLIGETTDRKDSISGETARSSRSGSRMSMSS